MYLTSNKTRTLLKWAIAVTAVIALVFLVRTFGVSSYKISTPAMESALHNGDFVLVDKWPFGNRIWQNKVILFSSPLQRDLDKKVLLLGRCIAMPGDTVQVSEDGYKTGGKSYPLPPTSLAIYSFPTEIRNEMVNLLRKLNIPARNLRVSSADRVTLQLSAFEEYQMRAELTERVNKEFTRVPSASYSLIIPRQGAVVRLQSDMPAAEREAVERETGMKVSFSNGKATIGNRNADAYAFRQNYYWVLSDNMAEGVDSRHVGFVPNDNIIGRVWLCWMSADPEHRFSIVR
jgi:signal peptidase I